jgi:acyl dehydratase
VKGSQLVLATAPFHLGVSKVEFVLTGGLLRYRLTATEGAEGWVVLWNTTTVPNGRYTLRCVAFDAAGHQSSSKRIWVRVAN